MGQRDREENLEIGPLRHLDQRYQRTDWVLIITYTSLVLTTSDTYIREKGESKVSLAHLDQGLTVHCRTLDQTQLAHFVGNGETWDPRVRRDLSDHRAVLASKASKEFGVSRERKEPLDRAGSYFVDLRMRS
jgi:hypothetical protein